MGKRSQISNEFMYLLGVSLLVFVIIFTLIKTHQSELYEKRDIANLNSIALKAQKEVMITSTIEN